MVKTSIPVHPANADQLRAWDGDEGAYWATHADRFDRSIAVHHERFMAAAAIRPGEIVLDVGCGAGQTTIEAALANVGAGVTGVDLSTSLLEIARRRAVDAGAGGVELVHADAQVHPFTPGSVDVVLGRTSAMFFSDHLAALRNLRRALRHDGRVVLLTWRPLEHNEWLREITAALTVDGPPRVPPPGAGPFSLSEPDRISLLLRDSGFADVEIEDSTGPMVFGADADDATTFILGLMGWMLDAADPGKRQRAVEALHRACAGHETSDGVAFDSGGWVITARAAG